MPWKEVRRVELRRLFVAACEEGGGGVAEACRRFGISRKTGYKWLGRYEAEGSEGLKDRSRRPHRVRYATDDAVVARLVAQRQAHGYWGVRKLCRRLEDQGVAVPPERTANRILKRAGLVLARTSGPPEVQRFERSRPNALWQMDHKKAVHGRWARRSVPWVVVDDASRYLLALRSLPDKGLASTWAALWETFGDLGLPEAMLSDNDGLFHGRRGPSQLEVRLLRLGIPLLHGRPYHPQTQGKVERLNGTLEQEVLRDGVFHSEAELQAGYDAFRERYNFERPHEALGLAVPASRYRPSERRRPAALPEMTYPSGAVLRRVQKDGWISWRGWAVEVGEGLFGQRVEVREADGDLEVYYGPYRLLGWTPDGSAQRRHQKLGLATASRPEPGEPPLRAAPSAAAPPASPVP
jgi:transposase InsO family protein